MRHIQLPPSELIFQVLHRNEGHLSDKGALVINTGKFTGRSPSDKFIVRDEAAGQKIEWNIFNQPFEEKNFNRLKKDVEGYLAEKNNVWIRDCFAGADPRYRIKIRICNEFPSGNLFASNMFIEPNKVECNSMEADWIILHAPDFKAKPEIHGTRQENFAVISLKSKTILIGGTHYTGEIKKAVFTIMNFLLPERNQILTMHCAANCGVNGDAALYFGLSGTGKTTLSSDPERRLIGDDEHGWSDEGVFNLERGCYAKVINLSAEKEPQIYEAIKHGALVENTKFFEGSNRIDYSDSSLTENTRASYPLTYIPGSIKEGMAGKPKNIFFLSCDAYGVLPPISKLEGEQVFDYFLMGYTAKIAGTENGIREPQATFSACFGAPFIPLSALRYANLLRQKLTQYPANVWLINTGWTGGGYNQGRRIDIEHTRHMIRAALIGELLNVKYQPDPIFGLLIPESCPGVPQQILNPGNVWENSEMYCKAANKLLQMFNHVKIARTAELDFSYQT